MSVRPLPQDGLRMGVGLSSHLPLATGKLNVDEPPGVADPLLGAALGGL